MQRRGIWRWAVGVTALMGLAWIGPDVGASAAEPSSGNSRVSVRSSPTDTTATACLSGRLGMTYETETTAEHFVLSVHSSAPRCSPIAATAVAYAMPPNGMTWPQQLIEARPLQIVDAGTVEITFERTCAPTQFDVVTGATPERIAPWADWHGPLLFPFDVATAFQDAGRDCAAPSPTTAAPATVAPVTAAPATTSPESEGNSTGPQESTPPVEVLAVTTVPPGAPADDGPVDPSLGTPVPTTVAGLALTGATTGILVAVALLMIVFGVGFVVGSWLRTRVRTRT